jgi:hypothetical protein
MTDDERKEVEEAGKAALKARVDPRLDLKLIAVDIIVDHTELEWALWGALATSTPD